MNILPWSISRVHPRMVLLWRPLLRPSTTLPSALIFISSLTRCTNRLPVSVICPLFVAEYYSIGTIYQILFTRCFLSLRRWHLSASWIEVLSDDPSFVLSRHLNISGVDNWRLFILIALLCLIMERTFFAFLRLLLNLNHRHLPAFLAGYWLLISPN